VAYRKYPTVVEKRPHPTGSSQQQERAATLSRLTTVEKRAAPYKPHTA